MFDYLTLANRKTLSYLDVGYVQTYRYNEVAPYVELKRTARKSYEFLGLTESAADKIVALKKAKYTRNERQWNLISGVWTPQIMPSCTATVSKRNDGNRFAVRVDVSEADFYYAKVSDLTGDSGTITYGLFNNMVAPFADLVDGRSYDDDNEGAPIEFDGNFSYSAWEQHGSEWRRNLTMSLKYAPNFNWTEYFTDTSKMRLQGKRGDNSWLDLTSEHGWTTSWTEGFVTTDWTTSGTSFDRLRVMTCINGAVRFSDEMMVKNYGAHT